jgi:serine/threonine-protein kinase ULK/ATG1
MSPQVLLGEPYTIKCDVWSCGIVFYKILFNLFPWERTDNVESFVEKMKK